MKKTSKDYKNEIKALKAEHDVLEANCDKYHKDYDAFEKSLQNEYEKNLGHDICFREVDISSYFEREPYFVEYFNEYLYTDEDILRLDEARRPYREEVDKLCAVSNKLDRLEEALEKKLDEELNGFTPKMRTAYNNLEKYKDTVDGLNREIEALTEKLIKARKRLEDARTLLKDVDLNDVKDCCVRWRDM